MEWLTEKRESGAWPKKGWTDEGIAECLDRLAAYEDTGLEPEEIDKFKKDIKKIKDDVDSLFEKQAFLNFLESKGIDTNIGVNWMCDVFDMLHDEKNNEIIGIDRLRELVQADREGRCFIGPFVAMIERSLSDGEMKPQRDQRFNGRYAVVYFDPKKWSSPLIDICGKPYHREEAEERMKELKAALRREQDGNNK